MKKFIRHLNCIRAISKARRAKVMADGLAASGTGSRSDVFTPMHTASIPRIMPDFPPGFKLASSPRNTWKTSVSGRFGDVPSRILKDFQPVYSGREIFLERIDGLIPWACLEARIAPTHPKGGRKGRQPHPLSAMLPLHCVQLFYNLSDPAMEDLLAGGERPALCQGRSEKVPDKTTIPTSAAGWSATD